MHFLDEQVITDIRKGNVNAVLAALFDENVNLQEPDTGNTALHIAIIYHKNDISSKLLDVQCLNVNAKNKKGETPFHMTILNRNLKIFNCMYKKRKDLIANAKDNQGNNIMHYAAMKQFSIHETRRLYRAFKKMAVPIPKLLHSQNSEGNVPLHTAVTYGSTETAEIYVSVAPDTVEIRNNMGQIPLDIAFGCGKPSIEFLLLRSTPDSLHPPNILDRLIIGNSVTLLNYFLSPQVKPSQSLSLCSKFRKPKSRIDACPQNKVCAYNEQNSSDGTTAIHRAVMLRKLEALTVLLRQPDVDLSLQNHDGNTPAHLAFQFKDDLSVGCLIILWLEARNKMSLTPSRHHNCNVPSEFKCPPNSNLPIWPIVLVTVINRQNNKGQCLLHLLVTFVSNPLNKIAVDGINRLIKLGANVELPDIEGNTPLLSAVHYVNIPALNALLSKGASTNVRNKAGVGPLDIAFARMNDDLVAALTQSAEDTGKSFK